MGEWRDIMLGEIADFRNGKALSPEEYTATGRHPVFGSNGQIARSDKVLYSEPAIVIGRVGAYCGCVHFVPRASWVTDNAIVAQPKDGNDIRYLFYLLGSLELQRTAIGSAQPLMTQGGLKVVRTKAPPLPVQRAIAHILGTLDDKIELNRRMNETLEAMARALFKSWFVDFLPVRAKMLARTQTGDPVRAKMEGRPYLPPVPLTEGQSDGLLSSTSGRGARGEGVADLPPLPRGEGWGEGVLWHLFPDSFEDSELGEIPKGWRVSTIGELADVVGGSTPSTAEPSYWERGCHRWATPKDLSPLTVPVLLSTERQISDSGLAQIGSGLLPRGTVLLSSRAPIGYLAIAEVPVAINQGFIAMKPKPNIPNLFLLHWARASHEDIVSHANGSTFLEISKANFRPILVIRPPDEALSAFDKLARPLYRKLVINEYESRTLAALRDTLLPKLISGSLGFHTR